MDRTRWRAGRRQRVHEGSLWRLMGTWRRAGGMAAGGRPPPATGVGPGGVSAPVLAHICRHQGREAWCERAGQPRWTGGRVLTRCADDWVSGGARAADAQTRRGV
jgi:hypothetical protein